MPPLLLAVPWLLAGHLLLAAQLRLCCTGGVARLIAALLRLCCNGGGAMLLAALLTLCWNGGGGSHMLSWWCLERSPGLWRSAASCNFPEVFRNWVCRACACHHECKHTAYYILKKHTPLNTHFRAEYKHLAHYHGGTTSHNLWCTVATARVDQPCNAFTTIVRLVADGALGSFRIVFPCAHGRGNNVIGS